jgi:hypothetical protein
MHNPKVLHVVVGHGLPAYFLNAVRSVRAASPRDHLLVIDNASRDRGLHDQLARMADTDELVDVIFRTENDLEQNGKVGSLYSAYEVALDYAIGREFDLLHLMQGDFQLMWWDADLVARSMQIFDAHPRCVNIQLQIFSRDMQLTDEVESCGADGLTRLRKYGLTDSGLYHLGRWRAWDMRFGPSEQAHGERYLGDGLEVPCHPWPTDVPIPWPAVVRGGVQRGREVITSKPFLIKPLSAAQITGLKSGGGAAWREDLCVPWGWACATPMWATDLDSIDYWVMRYRDARENGIRHLFPRLELRGVDPEIRRKLIGRYQHRPSLFQLFVACPARHVVRRLGERMATHARHSRAAR